MSAFQALGGFISTFADPSNTGLYFNDEGDLMAGNPRDFAKKLAEDDHPQAEQLLTELDRISQEGECSSSSDSLESPSTEVPPDVNLDPEPMNLETEEPASPAEQETESSTEQQENTTNSPEDTLSPAEDTSSPPRDICGSPEESSVGNVDQCSSESSSNNNNQCDSSSDSVAAESAACDPEGASAALDNHSNSGDVSTSTSQPVYVHLHNTEEYNNFQFWRTPLPEVDVDLELVNGVPRAIKITTRLHENDNTVRTKQISVDVPTSDSQQVTEVTDSLRDIHLEGRESREEGSPDKEDSDEDELMMHTASVSMVNDETETVTNIGSTHVLGQHLEESTMSIINGIVQGEILKPHDAGLR